MHPTTSVDMYETMSSKEPPGQPGPGSYLRSLACDGQAEDMQTCYSRMFGCLYLFDYLFGLAHGPSIYLAWPIREVVWLLECVFGA